MEIKAIETRYNGYRFRSRLEARWAVFFDKLGVKFEYEKDGYDLGELGWYLPDFFLPEVRDGVWIECKSESDEGLKVAHSKLRALAKLTGFDAMMVPGDPLNGTKPDQGTWASHGWIQFKEYGEDGPFAFCLCPWCGKVGLEFDGRGARVCGALAHYPNYDDALNSIKHLGHWRADDKCYTYQHPRIIDAATLARGEQFTSKVCK